jgi:NTE family protein
LNRLTRQLIWLFVALRIVFCPASALPQQAPTSSSSATSSGTARPRIGLVLSGGSALGLSHVGVIQWLEEHRVPVDVIAGTSMGGLVGGLFATGSDAAEMKTFVQNTDWASAFSSVAPFYDSSFRRKEDRREFPNKLELGLKNGISLPSSLSSGQEVGLIISRFAAPYSELKSFDDLPTPFRCVATDLLNGEQVIFSSGDLPVALRATMSLPGIFAPVPYLDKVLVDGGLLNNLPVDVAKTMGPDIIIAVELIDPPAKEPKVRSLVGVLGRSMAVMIDENAKKNRSLANILISPKVDDLGSSAFARYEEFEKRGYEAAERMRAQLERLSVSEEEWQRYLSARRAKQRPAGITPQSVEVTGATDRAAAVIKQEFGEPLLRKPVETVEIEDELNRLVGQGVYQSAAYRFVQRDGSDALLINTQPKAQAPPFLNTGINIEGSETNNIRFGFGARLTFLDLGKVNSEWRTDFTVGVNNSITSEYYWRLRSSQFFFAPRAFFSRRQEDLYVGNSRTSELQVRETGMAADIGLAGGRFSEARLGYIFDDLAAKVVTGPAFPGLEEQRPHLHTLRLRWAWDSQDSPVIPRRGIHAITELRGNLVRSSTNWDYGTVQQTISAPKSFGPRYILLGNAGGGATFGTKTVIPPFSLGGTANMSAFGRGQLRGNYYYYGSAFGLRAFSADRTSWLNRTYIAVGAEAGSAFNDVDRRVKAYDGLVGIASETAVGALMVGASWGTQGNDKFFFRLGRLF